MTMGAGTAMGADTMADCVWTKTAIAPADILDAIKTIDGHAQCELSLIPKDWVEADQYLAWAQAGLGNDNPLGWEVGLTYAKRSVCRRIDGLLLNNYFGQFIRAKYPAKIELLKAIGIKIPNLVQNWIIQGRNRIEHDYRLADKDHATDAVEIAGLFLDATFEEAARKVALITGGAAINHQYTGEFPGIDTKRLNSLGMSANPTILFDPYAEPAAILIIYPNDLEVRYALTADFQTKEMIEFAQRMRGYPSSLAQIRGFLPDGLLDGNQAVIEAFKKRANL
jgi:hypothetical protein